MRDVQVEDLFLQRRKPAPGALCVLGRKKNGIMQDNTNLLFKQLTTVLVALAGSVSLLISGGQFNLWTTIVGITLFLVLHTYGRPASEARSERVTFGAVWSLCILLAVGWLLSLLMQLFGSNLYIWGVIIGGVRIKPFTLSTFAFICWLVAFVIVSRGGLQKQGHS